jgi:hypothetical protein
MFGIFNFEEFVSMNYFVLDNYENTQDNTWYCVAKPGTPTTRTAQLPTPTRNITDMLTEAGTPSHWFRYWLVSEKDTCKLIERANWHYKREVHGLE